MLFSFIVKLYLFTQRALRKRYAKGAKALRFWSGFTQRALRNSDAKSAKALRFWYCGLESYALFVWVLRLNLFFDYLGSRKER